MDFIDKNFQTLQKMRPTFYHCLKKLYDEGSYSLDDIEEVETRDGNRALTIEKNGKKIRLNSLFRPLQEAEKWADQYSYSNLRIPVFMFGIGNGIFLREMLKRLGSDAVVFLMEPDISVFIYQLLHQDFSDILSDKRVILFVKGINENSLRGNLDTYFHWSMIPSQIVCHHPGYDKLYLKDCLEFRKTIKYADEVEIVNCNTISHLSKNIVKNVLKNLHFIKNSNYAGEFVNSLPEDIPVIIVSAGPSLDKNILELKRAKGKAFVIATDTSVKYLLKYNVPFDAMLTLDANKSPKHICAPECTNIPLFCALEARNQIMEFHQGRKIWFRSGLYIETLYKKFERKFPEYNTGGSVATAAYMLAVGMGARRIILMGQDLAYLGDTETTHAGGVERHVANEQLNIEMIDGVDGNKVRSRGDWIMYRDWFEEAIALKNAPEVIDATEGGALIKGTKIMKLSEAIDQYCVSEYHFSDVIEKVPYTFDEEEYQKVKDECNKLRSQFSLLKNKGNEALAITGELKNMLQLGEKNAQKENKKIAALKKINDLVNKQTANELLEIYISGETTSEIQRINKMTEDEDENMRNTLEISTIVYQEMIKAIDELKPLLQESLAKL